jgi:putative ABC transport system substrate-binding protein
LDALQSATDRSGIGEPASFDRFDPVDIWRRAAFYVDRILRGAKPAELPVQFPTKFEMVVNRRTATALGLAVAPSILLRADEVIE